MYELYEKFLKNIDLTNIKDVNFKNNNEYNSILEHVSFEYGVEYLRLIEEQFPNITINNILEFVHINDNYGYPNKCLFLSSTGKSVECSSTSLRYIYHALLIINDYSSKECNLPIVEVGCGYGGLFLSICFFSKLLNVRIPKYYIIDLDIVGKLIGIYLDVNRTHVNIDYSIHSAEFYGSDIFESDFYFISNYCFTEIDKNHRDNYIKFLLNRSSHGFITWQTVFGYDLNNAQLIFNTSLSIEEETPQTSYNNKNYFVKY